MNSEDSIRGLLLAKRGLAFTMTFIGCEIERVGEWARVIGKSEKRKG
jgi:hypothetical protein